MTKDIIILEGETMTKDELLELIKGFKAEKIIFRINAEDPIFAIHICKRKKE